MTSFVRPDVIPQLADAAAVLEAIDVLDGVSLSVLVPNERGLDRALEHRDRFHEVSVFLSASETHNRKNVNRTISESLDGLRLVIGRARDAGLRCEAVISTSFGCPYEGVVPAQRVAEIARELVDAGAQEIGFGDTTGMANPRQVRELFPQWREALGEVELTAHFHNTRGQGLANVLAALDAGVTSFESIVRRARRVSGAGRRHGQRRDRGRRLDAGGDGHQHRDRPAGARRRDRDGARRARPPARLARLDRRPGRLDALYRPLN